MDKQLFIHIGSPKTGTTAIQGFLKNNGKPLRRAGVNYMSTGRVNIAHNGIAGAFRKGQAGAVCDDLCKEIEGSKFPVHILSSEMFFRPAVARIMGKGLAEGLPAELRAQTKVIVYLRRQDRYLEALYKQLVKNARIPTGAMAFHDKKLESLAYAYSLDPYAAAFGHDNIIVRPFERQQFPNGDVIEDFVEKLGVDLTGELVRPDISTNKTFSLEMSEVLGLLSQETRLNTRDLIRALIAIEPPDVIRSNDVYDRETRTNIVAHHAERNEQLRQTYCPDLETLFDTSDLEAGSKRNTADTDSNWRAAIKAAALAIGHVETHANPHEKPKKTEA